MDKRIKYVVAYSLNKDSERVVSPAGMTKATYVCEALNKVGYGVDIISARETSAEKGIFKQTKTNISEHNTLLTCSSFGVKSDFMKRVRIVFTWIWLLLYLILYTKKDDNVLVYHSLSYACPVYLAKKIKRFNLILEVEEIYQDANQYSNFFCKLEYKIISSADRYIFVTEELNKKLNSFNKPYLVIPGTYKCEERLETDFGDDKIHVVFAGTLAERKGSDTVVNAALCLPEKYHVHILGFGNDNEINRIKDAISDVSLKTKATVSYDGLKTGDDYIRFIQKCHIGMSAQDMDAKFNNTSFPSKILAYMSNGLRVVTVRIPVVENSSVGKCLYYYETQSPEKIAEAIMSVRLDDNYDSRSILKELDKSFCESLYEFIK